MQPHRSSALDGAAAASTVALRRGVAVPLSWSWFHQPQGRACAAAPALRGTLYFHPNPLPAACWKFGLLRRTHAGGLSCSSGALLQLPPPKINLVDALPKSRISHLDTLKYLLTKSYRTTLYTKQGRSDKP